MRGIRCHPRACLYPRIRWTDRQHPSLPAPRFRRHHGRGRHGPGDRGQGNRLHRAHCHRRCRPGSDPGSAARRGPSRRHGREPARTDPGRGAHAAARFGEAPRRPTSAACTVNALLSVSDKTGLSDFARGLAQLGVTMYATGGTERALREAGIPVHALQELTGFPEMLDGRVKTLHPNVHAGILARRDEPRHLQELADRELKLIDLVVVNLYPFVETVSAGAGPSAALEAIQHGGGAWLRAAAKNHDHVLPVVRPSDYPIVLQALKDPAGIPATLQRHLAAVVFAHTAAYDAAIGEHLRAPYAHKTLPEAS